MSVAMHSAYSNFIADNDRTPGVVDAGEAQELISIARNINAQNSGCCSTSTAGDRELGILMTEHPDRFDPQATNEIESYLRRYSTVSVGPSPVIVAPSVVIGPRPWFGLGGFGWRGGWGHHGFAHHGGGHHGFGGRHR
jgi:hypothetical protein